MEISIRIAVTLTQDGCYEKEIYTKARGCKEIKDMARKKEKRWQIT